jgi:hypothetical protein
MAGHAHATSRILADLAARQIQDPVTKLRFLRTIGPVHQKSTFSSKYLKVFVMTSAIALLAVAPWSLRFVKAQDKALTAHEPAPVRIRIVSIAPEGPASVWTVENTPTFETYSNGLRLEKRYETGNRSRSYYAFPITHPESGIGQQQTAPIGVVFHTTESLQAPFAPEQTAVLKRVGESLLEYVRRRRAYNFVIDRFGRVYRIVRENDAANHAGHSVWADEKSIYVNLNDSFLGVSFEARTAETTRESEINPAQVRSAAMLTEMLRSRYRISAGNCVTHGQVSVNSSSRQVGYHTDWGSSFPFERLGLPDNYARPLPSLVLFGFGYDSGFVSRVGARLVESAELGERQLRAESQANGMSLEAYRKLLYKRYLHVSEVSKRTAAQTETD